MLSCGLRKQAKLVVDCLFIASGLIAENPLIIVNGVSQTGYDWCGLFENNLFTYSSNDGGPLFIFFSLYFYFFSFSLSCFPHEV